MLHLCNWKEGVQTSRRFQFGASLVLDIICLAIDVPQAPPGWRKKAVKKTQTI